VFYLKLVKKSVKNKKNRQGQGRRGEGQRGQPREAADQWDPNGWP